MINYDRKHANILGYTWIPTTVYAGLPPSAVYAGNDSDGTPIYVGRAFFEGQQLPCKVMPSKNAAYVSYAGREHFVSNYEVIDRTVTMHRR